MGFPKKKGRKKNKIKKKRDLVFPGRTNHAAAASVGIDGISRLARGTLCGRLYIREVAR